MKLLLNLSLLFPLAGWTLAADTAASPDMCKPFYPRTMEGRRNRHNGISTVQSQLVDLAASGQNHPLLFTQMLDADKKRVLSDYVILNFEGLPAGASCVLGSSISGTVSTYNPAGQRTWDPSLNVLNVNIIVDHAHSILKTAGVGHSPEDEFLGSYVVLEDETQYAGHLPLKFTCTEAVSLFFSIRNETVSGYVIFDQSKYQGLYVRPECQDGRPIKAI